MHHWYTNYWVQYIAQNVMPPSFWTLVGISLAHWHQHKHAERRHNELKEHITKGSSDALNV